MDSSKLMGTITTVVLGAIVAYIAALALGKLSGDISTVLFILTLVSFAYWLYDRIALKPQRVKSALAIEAQVRANSEGMAQQDVENRVRAAVGTTMLPPWWIEWTAGFFWVIFFVFFVRSFIVEPYRIPSGSMMPTLESGDFILVSKSGYGIKLPVINKQITEFKKPKRGEVVVFSAPNENLVMIKRIIGEPGDTVVYRNKELTINGKKLPFKQVEDYLNTDVQYFDPQTRKMVKGGDPILLPQFEETIDGVVHKTLKYPQRNRYDITAEMGFVSNRPFIDECTYEGANFTCHIPPGHYFMMGDNRDDSLDSRYWGFVPEENIVGKAFFIWLNVGGKLGRIGSFD